MRRKCCRGNGLEQSRILTNHHLGGEDDGMRRSVSCLMSIKDPVSPGWDHEGFGVLTGRETADAQQGGAVSGVAGDRQPRRRAGSGIRGEGWRGRFWSFAGKARWDCGDAAALRDDPARWLAPSDRAGATPLGDGGHLTVAADAFVSGGGVVGEGRRRSVARGAAAGEQPAAEDGG